MGLIVDSSVLIRHERSGRSISFSRFAAHETVAIAAVTVSELFVGVHLADTAERRSRRLAFVEGLMNVLPVLDFTSDTARVHARVHAELRRSGNPIGAHDLLIAATAVEHGYAVLTNNTREFDRVPALQVVSFDAADGECDDSTPSTL